MDFDKPILTELGVKYFINASLRNCREFKTKYNNNILNIILLLVFLGIIFFILLVKYKGKLTPAEKEMKNLEKQQYILTKVKNYQDSKLRASSHLITGLPDFTNY